MSRNFRLFCLSQTVSAIGDDVHEIAPRYEYPPDSTRFTITAGASAESLAPVGVPIGDVVD